ncbi:hypothetical protein [Microbacterium sp. 1.5R]|uniref:hypothetical protein n=1 Tax=Microbacterium sp. 1.5R TaxID=1916917 RepID=UPI000AA60B08|nr:hypothetical protein [Microbacterium sp. 1.5R]
MSTPHSRMLLAAVAVIGMCVLAACSSGSGGASAPTSSASPTWDAASVPPPEGRVIGTGTVLDVGGEPRLCLGIVAESYPPQCSGLPLDGWTWDGVDGSESSGDTTWGTYAVYGTFDGERYAVTDPPIMLALYDPVRPEDPTGGVPGASSEAELAQVSDELSNAVGRDALTLWTERGYVWMQVVWDDGSVQNAMDAAYGDGVVVVTSALREID